MSFTPGPWEAHFGVVNCGDCGNWNPEEEQPVIAARAAIAKATAAKGAGE